MKIACVMVTEARSPIWGIGLSSFLTQTHLNSNLLVVLPPGQKQQYIAAAEASKLTAHPHWKHVEFVEATGNQRERLDEGCRVAFYQQWADLVAIFDDDDWAPEDRLTKTDDIRWDSSIASYCSYTHGWFVNLRTLQGELIDTLPAHLWGGCLTFNKIGFERADGFANKPQPGKDRAFMAALKGLSIHREHRLRCKDAPVAFSHGKNIATWLKKKGVPMGGTLKTMLPPIVLNEVVRCQQLMFDTRTFPPQPEQ